MIGVGKLVAEEVLGEKSQLLEPFRFSRFVEGNCIQLLIVLFLGVN